MNIENILSKVLNLVFPEKCIVCKREETYFCRECFLKVDKFVQKKENIYSIYEYKNKEIKLLIKKLKYAGSILPAKRFAETLAEFINQNFSKYQKVYINPIPLRKRDSRLYNHAEKIAEETIFFLKNKFNLKNIEIINLLEKVNLERQASLNNISDRKQNILGKVLLKESKVKIPEKSLLIILDDVYTTGSTFLEAEKIFLANKEKYNFEEIICLAVAH